MAAHKVRALLMGGQACVFYGAAEFSRDTDLAVLADMVNWRRITAALKDLRAERIYFPAPELRFLKEGFALHFRCHHPEADAMRVDLMSVMRGVDDFPKLWKRRVSLQDDDGTVYQLLSIRDLVQAKKTQRDKDWPMIRRLVEMDYLQNRNKQDSKRLRFWLLELRTPELLIEAAKKNPPLAKRLISKRPLLGAITDENELASELLAEEHREREIDRIYWSPLKQQLEKFRRAR